MKCYCYKQKHACFSKTQKNKKTNKKIYMFFYFFLGHAYLFYFFRDRETSVEHKSPVWMHKDKSFVHHQLLMSSHFLQFQVIRHSFRARCSSLFFPPIFLSTQYAVFLILGKNDLFLFKLIGDEDNVVENPNWVSIFWL